MIYMAGYAVFLRHDTPYINRKSPGFSSRGFGHERNIKHEWT